MPLIKVEPVKALGTSLKGFLQSTKNAKMEDNKTVKILSTSSKDSDKFPTSRISNRFDPNAYRLVPR